MRCACLLLLVVLMALGALAGCGGGGGGPAVQGDVAVIGAVTTAPNQITQVTVTTANPGDTIDTSQATARIERADGTSAAVPLASNVGGTQITLGPATVAPSDTAADAPAALVWNVLQILGPLRFTDGPTGTTVIIGRMEFRFEVLADGTVISPTAFTVSIPTSGAARNRTVTFRGLSPNPPDYVQTTIRDNQGGITTSSVHGADAAGNATLTDSHGRITGQLLSGNNSRVTLMFARTDTDADGVPDLME